MLCVFRIPLHFYILVKGCPIEHVIFLLYCCQAATQLVSSCSYFVRGGALFPLSHIVK
jgi:hypothetical protein